MQLPFGRKEAPRAKGAGADDTRSRAAAGSAKGSKGAKGARSSARAERDEGRSIFGAPALIMGPRLLFIFAVLALCILGMVMIYSASSITAYSDANFGNDSTYFFKKQVIWLAIGLAACLVCVFAPYRLWADTRVAWALHGVSLLLHMEPEGYTLAVVPALNWLSALQVTGMAALCAVLSVIFCAVMHISGHSFKKWMKNPYVRAIAGGAAIIALTLLVGTRDYNGAGAQVIERAIEGEARPWDFILKLVFTAITLGCGYKGGEIVPTFFVGATFGCVVGPLLGMNPGFAAAIALVATFCGNTNCPVASVFLASSCSAVRPCRCSPSPAR